MYRASAGSVYPNLQLLEDEGLIKADVKEDGKRVFTITDSGLAELAKQRMWQIGCGAGRRPGTTGATR